MFAGGVFNRSINIHLGERYSFTIQQKFTSIADKDTFRFHTYVQGTLPDLSADARVDVAAFEEHYHHDKLGYIRAYDERHVTIDDRGDKRTYKLTVNQQFHYNECPSKVRQMQE